MRITSFSPNAVGRVDNRSSTSWPVGRARLDPAILRPALLDHVHAAENLDAAGHGVQHRHRNLIHLMQHAVDAKADDADVAARLDMDVRRALVEGVLPEPVDDQHDVLVVGVERALGLAHLDQLFEVRDADAGNVAPRQGLLHRLGQVVELDLIAARCRPDWRSPAGCSCAGSAPAPPPNCAGRARRWRSPPRAAALPPAGCGNASHRRSTSPR